MHIRPNFTHNDRNIKLTAAVSLDIANATTMSPSQKQPSKCCSFFSNNWSTILIWATGVILMTGLAAKNMYPLFYEYLNNNRGTQMEIVTTNETVKPPSLTFCMPFVPVTLEKITKHLQSNSTSSCYPCKKLAQNFLDIEQANITFSPDFYTNQMTVASFLFKKLIESDNFTILDARNTDWNQPIFEAVWLLFSSIGVFDSDGTKNLTWQLYGVDQLISNRQKIDTAYEHLVFFLCEYIVLGEKKANICVDYLPKASSHLFDNKFCFWMPTAETGGKVTVNSLGRYGVVQAFANTAKRFHVYFGTDLISWPLGSSGEGDVIFSSGSSEEVLSRALESVTLKYHVGAVVSGKNSNTFCYKERTYSVCISNCMVWRIIEHYRCIPFTYRKRSPSLAFPHLPYCNGTSENDAKFDIAMTREACNRQNCSNPCEYVSYQFKDTRKVSSGYSSRTFSLKLRPVSAPYVQFSIIARQTWEQFVADVAGIMNLYLGYSGLTIVAILVECVNFYKKWKMKKGSVDNTIAPIDLRHFDNYDALKVEAQVYKRMTAMFEEKWKAVDDRLAKIERRSDYLHR